MQEKQQHEPEPQPGKNLMPAQGRAEDHYCGILHRGCWDRGHTGAEWVVNPAETPKRQRKRHVHYASEALADSRGESVVETSHQLRPSHVPIGTSSAFSYRKRPPSGATATSFGFKFV
jgi:hypothetical protein